MSASGRKVSGWTRFLPPNRAGKYPWRKRWLGLLPLLGLATLGGWWAWDHMEDGLHERAVAHLACEGIDANALDMDWSYRDVDIEGKLPAGMSADRLKSIIDEGSDNAACLADAGIDADSNPGVYDVDVGGVTELAAEAQPTVTPVPEPTAAPTATPEPEPTATPEPEPTATPEPEPTATPEPAPADPLTANASFDGTAITLAGAVASDAQRQALIDAAAAAVGADNVVDNLTVDAALAADGNEGLVNDLAQVIGHYGSDLVGGTAQLAAGELSWDLLAASDEVASKVALPGSGVVSAVEAADPPEDARPLFTG